MEKSEKCGDGERFYQNDQPQCSYQCVVGELGRAKVCVCELVAGHEGAHERIPTTQLAGGKDCLSWYRSFVAVAAE